MKPATAWAFYDFANSAYALLITGVGFQIYFKRILGPHLGHYSDLIWGCAVAGSIVTSAVLSPILGAAADTLGLHKKLFVWTSLAAILFTCSLATIGPSSVAWGIGVFFVANFFYSLALFFYDAFLKFVSLPENSGRVSGFGWGFGYVGGLVCLALSFPFFTKEPSPGHTWSFRIGFLVVGVFYLLFSLPAFAKLKGSSAQSGMSLFAAFNSSRKTVQETLLHWREYREQFKFLLAYYFISEAIMTAIYFMANYLSTTFAMKAKSILLLTVIVQLIAFPATWAAGHWADRWNLKVTLVVSTGVWALIVVLIAEMQSWLSLYVVCILMGLVIGSTQALARSLLANITPESKINELFGFNSLSSKVAATIGPLVFGLASSATANQRIGWLSLLPFLFIGAALTLAVNEDTPKAALRSGRRHAVQAQP